jgi:hypothetical protein
MLYPDREQTRFMQKNIVTQDAIATITTLQQMIAANDNSVIVHGLDNIYRFNADLSNKSDLKERLLNALDSYPQLDVDQQTILKLYETTFDHQSFTGRSGGMFGFEGLGSIYWHMVSKLLLALAENYTTAQTQGANKDTLHSLGTLYYKVREGIGFNKTPQEYGAFPTDPYSHTPKHAGAQQPGMTGQVKEELISRFTELGIAIDKGEVSIQPSLLRQQEFITEARDFWYLDTQDEWQCLKLEPGTLAFTWSQIPFIYVLSDTPSATTLLLSDGSKTVNSFMGLDNAQAKELFTRSGKLQSVTLTINPTSLFNDKG